MNTKIYHNPRCRKSRETLAILEERGIKPDIIEYLKTPPNTENLENILKALSLEPRQLMRTKETLYKELDLKNRELSRAQLIEIMIQNPILIERPIVITSKGTALGRPPENIVQIL